MATESFLVTALPNSADPAQPFHVSLFVAHRLTPDGTEGTVGDFPALVDWPTRLAGAEIRLLGHTPGGPTVEISSSPDLSQLDVAIWQRVFPTTLPVRPWETRDFTDVPWRSFAAHRMQQHSLLAHAAAVFSSPVDTPTMRGNPLTSLAMNAIGLGQWSGRRGLGVEDLFNPELRLDEWATNFLNDTSGLGFVGAGTTSSAETPLRLMATDAHCARLYYQPPEEPPPTYHERPVPGATAVPLHRPTPDYHERASMLGDVSPLLRRLGLVLDLRVDDLTALAGVTELGAELIVEGFDNTVTSQPHTSVQIFGTAFFVNTASGDYLGPLLRLGDEERFAVLDLDPDAQALKLENYLRNMPRMIATEVNGDRVTSAPHALRSSGFSMARIDRPQHLRDRLTGAPARAAALAAGTAPPLHIEDVTRGVRLEVWDDASNRWHSLHRRRIDVDVDGAGTVLSDQPDTGFLQGAALTRPDGPDGAVEGRPYNAHEVLAGWEGWSLSAPRPGKVIAHVDGEEQVLDSAPVDPTPIHPVATVTRVEPGTLPSLRYGRNYAFRAWAVDLAGNSAPHPIAGPDPAAPEGDAPAAAEGDADADATRVAGQLAAERLAAIDPDATTRYARAAMSEAGTGLRRELRAIRPPVTTGPVEGRGAPGLDLARTPVTGLVEVDRVVLHRVAQRTQRAREAATTARRTAVETAFTDAAHSSAPLMERTDARLDPTVLANALSAGIGAAASVTDPSTVDLGAVIAVLADLVTTPRPFLRWTPVVEPVVVPRHPYTEAESQLTIVIRSGVDLDDAGAVVIVPPESYAAATKAAHPELDLQWRADSQRHLLPPKTTQLEAEQSGMFDAAFGSADADAVQSALAASLRESGTLFDTTIADLATPGARLAQPGVALHTTPTAEEPAVTDPAGLPRGDMVTRGQYVVHDVDRLAVPYLPDPFAAGLSMVFPDAGHGHRLAGLFAIDGVRLSYRSEWPAIDPIRLVLESGEQLLGFVDESSVDAGHVVRIQVPAGEQLRFRLSSALDRDHLAWLGLWRSLPAVLQSLDVLAEAAADGWFWWLTPATEVRLIHAVPRPVELPRPTVMIPQRLPDQTDVAIFGAVDVHGPSTERLDLEGSWTEWIDDIAKPGPIEVTVQAAAAQVLVDPDDDLIVTSREDSVVPLPDGSSLRLRKVVHQLGDTRHRDIDYRYRATTRYREYFDQRVLPAIDDVSVLGPVRRLDVPSTSRPPKPVVRDVLPLFRWYTETEPDQPFALRRTRRSGLRVYLDRPWYASGNGELLAAVLAAGSDAAVAPHVSQWGADPVFLQQGPAARGALPLADFAHLIGLDDRPEAGRPVGPIRFSKLVDAPGQPQVGLLAYAPEYDTERRLWFVDVAMDPGTAFWPFVRLAVGRLQPSSLPGLDLSAVVHCDFVPLPPERIATVARPDDAHVRITVTGPVGVPGGLGGADFVSMLIASRTMRVRLERRVPDVPTDLGWSTVASLDLALLGVDGTTVSWSGELELPVPLAPRTPGTQGDLRVTIEEWERLPSDPPALGPIPSLVTRGVEARIVYADHIELG